VYERSHPGGKSILREAMSRIVPREFLDARKQGFSAPDESWFRGRAERFVRESLFDPSSPAAAVFDRAAVERVLALHGSGDRNFRLLIWSLLSIDRLMRRYGLPVGGTLRTAVAQRA
jgi:asparagine synthase (glutamine-hydrolysing)